MGGIIQVNYDELMTIASTCDLEASNMQQMYSNILSKMENLRGSWEGEAANKFFNEMDAFVLPNLKKLVDAFQTTSDTVNHIQQRFEESEQQAAGKFKVGAF
jgi:WXG100 family type VII secretion target